MKNNMPIVLTACQQDISNTGNALSAVAVTTADIIRDCASGSGESWAVCSSDILAGVSYLGMAQHDIARGMDSCYKYEGTNFTARCVRDIGDATDRLGSALAVLFDSVDLCNDSATFLDCF